MFISDVASVHVIIVLHLTVGLHFRSSLLFLFSMIDAIVFPFCRERGFILATFHRSFFNKKKKKKKKCDPCGKISRDKKENGDPST